MPPIDHEGHTVTQEPHPGTDTTQRDPQASIDLARLAAALNAWDPGSGNSSAMTGTDAVGEAGDGSSPVQAGQDGTAPASTSEIPPGDTELPPNSDLT
jgi:hypothetical protein